MSSSIIRSVSLGSVCSDISASSVDTVERPVSSNRPPVIPRSSRNSSLTIENLNKHNRSTNPGNYGYVIGWEREGGVKRYLFKSTLNYGNGGTREVFMYEDDKGEAWTVCSDVHIVYYDD